MSLWKPTQRGQSDTEGEKEKRKDEQKGNKGVKSRTKDKSRILTGRTREVKMMYEADGRSRRNDEAEKS